MKSALDEFTKEFAASTSTASDGRLARRQRRRRPNHAVAQGDPHAHRVGQEHAEDHAGDEAGRGGEAAPRAGRDRRRAPVRAAAHARCSATSPRAALEHGRDVASAARAARQVKTRAARRHHRRPRPRRRLQLERVKRRVERFVVDEPRARTRGRRCAIVGRKAREYFSGAATRLAIATAIVAESRGLGDRARARARARASRSTDDFLAGKVDARATSSYNEFKSAITQVVQIEQLLPVAPGQAARRGATAASTSSTSPSKGELLADARAAVRRDRSSSARCSSRSPPSSARA